MYHQRLWEGRIFELKVAVGIVSANEALTSARIAAIVRLAVPAA